MSEFRNAYSGQVRHTSLTGNGREPEYEYRVTDEGRELVKPVKQTSMHSSRAV